MATKQLDDFVNEYIAEIIKHSPEDVPDEKKKKVC